VYAIDAVPHRLAAVASLSPKVVPVNFKEHDPVKFIQEQHPKGLDGE